MDATTTSTSSTPASMVAAAAADTWLRRFRAILAGALGGVVAGIGALAFYTSFEAIKQYANGSGGIDPKHDFAIPLLVDSFIVVATGADLWLTTTGRSRQLWEIWWPKALLAGAVAVSFVLNVAHAEKGDWAARGVAAIPPAALVLGVELLMMVLRRATALRAERLAAAATTATATAVEDEPPPVEVRVSRSDPPPPPAGAGSKGTAGALSPPPKARSSPRTKRGQAPRTKRAPRGHLVNEIRAEINAARAVKTDLTPVGIVNALAARGVHVDKSQVWREINAPAPPNGKAPAPAPAPAPVPVPVPQEEGRPS
jgi:hypothetical protein